MPATLPHHSPTSSLVTTSQSAMVVDWSDIRSSLHQKPVNDEELISWVQNCPRPYNVRVYLPGGPHAKVVKLQRKLQSLGCTVTCRFAGVA